MSDAKFLHIAFIAVLCVSCDKDARIASSATSTPPTFPQKTIEQHMKDLQAQTCAQGDLLACRHANRDRAIESHIQQELQLFEAACLKGRLAACMALSVDYRDHLHHDKNLNISTAEERDSVMLGKLLRGSPSCDPTASKTCRTLHAHLDVRVARLGLALKSEVEELCEHDDVLACSLVHRHDKLCKLGQLNSCWNGPPLTDFSFGEREEAQCESAQWSACLPKAAHALRQAMHTDDAKKAIRLLEALRSTEEACGVSGRPWLPDDLVMAELLYGYCRNLSHLYDLRKFYQRYQAIPKMSKQVSIYTCRDGLHCLHQGHEALYPSSFRGSTPEPNYVRGIIQLNESCQQGLEEGCKELQKAHHKFPDMVHYLYPELDVFEQK